MSTLTHFSICFVTTSYIKRQIKQYWKCLYQHSCYIITSQVKLYKEVLEICMGSKNSSEQTSPQHGFVVLCLPLLHARVVMGLASADLNRIANTQTRYVTRILTTCTRLKSLCNLLYPNVLSSVRHGLQTLALFSPTNCALNRTLTDTVHFVL